MYQDDFKDLCALQGTPEEEKWLRERLETLTVKESLILTAAQMRQPAVTAADAIRQLCSLPDYTLIGHAESYEDLGRRYLEGETRLAWGLHDCADLEKLGRWYEDEHPGLFIGNCYAAYPKEPLSPSYDGTNLTALEDTDWSIKLKLASPAVPEGVWLRLPDHEEMNDDVGEIRLALDVLQVRTIEGCSLLEARCSLPSITNLAQQYDDLASLIYDGQNLGFILEEQGQGAPHFMEKFLAALEHENCRSLADALDISQNLNCYDFMTGADLVEMGREHLKTAGIPKSLIDKGCFDLEKCGSLLVMKEGFIVTGNGCYIRRNENSFYREHSQEPPPMTMTM